MFWKRRKCLLLIFFPYRISQLFWMCFLILFLHHMSRILLVMVDSAAASTYMSQWLILNFTKWSIRALVYSGNCATYTLQQRNVTSYHKLCLLSII